MLMIRLQRTGRKNAAQFRVVLTDKRNSTKSGRFKEILGNYEPKSGTVEFKTDRVKYWLSVGAQPSGTVHNFLVDQKIIDGAKINVLPKKTKIVKEVEESAESTDAVEEKTEETPAEEVSA